MSDMWAIVVGKCVACPKVFGFNAHKVPSISIEGRPREPICKDCVAHANTLRVATNMPPITYDDDAYEPMNAAEL
jgi:hypothetical protein